MLHKKIMFPSLTVPAHHIFFLTERGKEKNILPLSEHIFYIQYIEYIILLQYVYVSLVFLVL